VANPVVGPLQQEANLDSNNILYERVYHLKISNGDCNLVETRTDLCGCVFEIQEGIMVCVKRCPKHSRPKRKRPFRAKAECV